MRTLLLGQARSGTTALFLRMQSHLPAAGRAFFEPEAFTMPPRGDVLVKSLVMSLPMDLTRPPIDAHAFDHRVVLVRDPRDRLVSVLLFLLHWHSAAYPLPWQSAPTELADILCLLRQKEQTPASVSVTKLFQAVLWARFDFNLRRARSIWQHLQKGFLAFQAALPSHTLVWYETLMATGTPPTPRAYASLRRHATVGEWRQWFTPEDIPAFRPILLPYMERFGYADEWTLPTQQTIDPQYSSRYVETWLRVQRRAAHAAAHP